MNGTQGSRRGLLSDQFVDLSSSGREIAGGGSEGCEQENVTVRDSRARTGWKAAALGAAFMLQTPLLQAAPPVPLPDAASGETLFHPPKSSQTRAPRSKSADRLRAPQLIATLEPQPADDNSPLVTLNARNVPIEDVLKALADQTHTNIVTASGVTGNITLKLNNVSVDDALRLITRLNGLAYRRDGNTIVVAKEDQIKALFEPDTGPVLVPLVRATPQAVTDAVTKSYPAVKATAEGNSVVLSGPATDVAAARDFIQKLDAGSAAAAIVQMSVPLQTLQPDIAVTTLAKVYPQLTIVPGAKQVVLFGDEANVHGAADLARRLDIPPSASTEGFQSVVYEAKFADVSDLIRILRMSVPQVLAEPGPVPAFQSGSGAGGGYGGGGGASGGAGAGGGGASAGGASAGGASAGGASAGGASGGASAGGASAGGSSAGGASGGGAAGGGAGGSGGATGGLSVRSTLLLLTGTPDVVATAQSILAKVDIPRPMVQIEARVLDLNLEHLQSIGVNWSFSQGFQFGEISPPAIVPATVFPFKAGPLSRGGISASLDLLASDSHNKVLASPNVSVESDRTSDIFIGDEIHYVSNVDRSINGSTVTTATENVGIELFVAPHVNPDGIITMSVTPNVSVLTSLVPGANGAQLPLISKRSAQTTLRIRSGDTITIGGLIRDEDLTTMERVPLLSDLPFLGALFRHRQSTHQRSEVVLFLKATIVPGTAPAPPGPAGPVTPVPGA